jgi:hypothetical protein
MPAECAAAGIPSPTGVARWVEEVGRGSESGWVVGEEVAGVAHQTWPQQRAPGVA